MKDLVEYIVKNIVSKPDQVKVEEAREDSEVRILLSVDPEDMGVVIGKGGQIIKSIRKLLTVRAMAENVRVYLNLQEPESDKAEAVEEEK